MFKRTELKSTKASGSTINPSRILSSASVSSLPDDEQSTTDKSSTDSSCMMTPPLHSMNTWNCCV